MDIQFHGANCLTIGTKHARVVIDDNLADIGAKSITKPGDIVLSTSEIKVKDAKTQVKIVIDQPGEYEVSGISIYGIGARAHMDEQGQKTAVMYKLVADELRILVTGHIFPELNDAQLEAIGMVDIMFVPVGGNGYTLDSVGALKVIKDIEPKLVVPTHYDIKGLQYPMPQHSLEDALKTLSMEPKERLSKLKLKPADLGETMQLIVLEP